ncbi:MAG: hypothetical protein HY320_08195 [Armatimonadetes bacterium]|nr:hypothetical protein [Armatimonadota bacterium]
MRPHEFVLLAMETMGGQVQGRTLLQKCVYFLAMLTDNLPLLDYGPHYYGPYSGIVSDAVGALRSLGFVDERRVGLGMSDRSGFEMARHDYSLTADGKKIAALKRQQHPKLSKQLQEAWGAIEKAGVLDYMTLSVAAKIHHILREVDAPITRSDVWQAAEKLGWSLRPDQAAAERFLMKLGLIEVQSE